MNEASGETFTEVDTSVLNHRIASTRFATMEKPKVSDGVSSSCVAPAETGRKRRCIRRQQRGEVEASKRQRVSSEGAKAWCSCTATRQRDPTEAAGRLAGPAPPPTELIRAGNGSPPRRCSPTQSSRRPVPGVASDPVPRAELLQGYTRPGTARPRSPRYPTRWRRRQPARALPPSAPAACFNWTHRAVFNAVSARDRSAAVGALGSDQEQESRSYSFQDTGEYTARDGAAVERDRPLRHAALRVRRRRAAALREPRLGATRIETGAAAAQADLAHRPQSAHQDGARRRKNWALRCTRDHRVRHLHGPRRQVHRPDAIAVRPPLPLQLPAGERQPRRGQLGQVPDLPQGADAVARADRGAGQGAPVL
ncbi:hypothetical protein ON010_g18473 [Phytophthora cinnamomi]|nr:hypothetical protein ON010_g18473 [Phytophthora cinnamomi]